MCRHENDLHSMAYMHITGGVGDQPVSALAETGSASAAEFSTVYILRQMQCKLGGCSRQACRSPPTFSSRCPPLRLPPRFARRLAPQLIALHIRYKLFANIQKGYSLE